MRREERAPREERALEEEERFLAFEGLSREPPAERIFEEEGRERREVVVLRLLLVERWAEGATRRLLFGFATARLDLELRDLEELDAAAFFFRFCCGRRTASCLPWRCRRFDSVARPAQPGRAVARAELGALRAPEVAFRELLG